jgi:hypothetical protein
VGLISCGREVVSGYPYVSISTAQRFDQDALAPASKPILEVPHATWNRRAAITTFSRGD